MFNALNIISDVPMSDAPTSFLKCSPNVTFIGSKLSARINIWVVCLLKDIDVASVGTKMFSFLFPAPAAKGQAAILLAEVFQLVIFETQNLPRSYIQLVTLYKISCKKYLKERTIQDRGLDSNSFAELPKPEKRKK